MSSQILRKLVGFGDLCRRALARYFVDASQFRSRPPIFVNSIPKSGTHLLNQVVQGIPHSVSSHYFIASSPSFPPVTRHASTIISRVSSVLPGEIVSGHVYYAREYSEAMDAINALKLLIVRDPRAIAVSEAHYLHSMNRFHYMHREFRRLCIKECIRASFFGLPDKWWRPKYTDLTGRLRPYLGWLDDDSVLVVRYEELVDPRTQTKLLEKIAENYSERLEEPFRHRTSDVVLSMKESIDPKKSHTFRTGRPDAWRDDVDEDMLSVVNKECGELIRALGYQV